MAYERLIKAYLADRATANPNYSSAVVTDCVDLEFDIAANGGCIGGKIVLSGHVREGFKLYGVGHHIKAYYDASNLLWSGFVRTLRKSVESSQHVYILDGWWSRLTRVDMTGRQVLTSTTPEGIVSWLFTNRINPAGLGISSGTITASGQTVSEFVIEEGADIHRIIETMRVMATAGGTEYAAGIDATGALFFRPISTTVGNLQATVTVGTDATIGEEEHYPRAASNRARVIGGYILTGDNAGYRSNKRFENAASIAVIGRTKERYLFVPGLRKEIDLTVFWNGYVQLYGNPSITLNAMERVHSDGDPLPFPWLGQARYSDTQRGIVQTEYLRQVRYHFGPELKYNLQIGRESGTGSSSDFAPDTYREMLGVADMADAFSADYETLPEATDLTDPYENAPHMDGDGVPGGDGTLDRGTDLHFFYPGAVNITDDGTVDRPNFNVIIFNGGTALASDAVEVWYRHFDLSDPPVEIDSDAIVLERVDTQGELETWATPADTPHEFDPTAGNVYVATRIKTQASPAQYVWDPMDIASDGYKQCPSFAVVDLGGVSLSSGMVIYATWPTAGA